MSTAPPDWEDPRRVLSRHGMTPQRRWSQNFLVSRSAVERIAESVAPTQGQRIVELGPGTGTLTAALLRAGARVIAVERDPRMLELLRRELSDQPVELLLGDAAAIDLCELRHGDAPTVSVVGNLPYAITGAIMRNLLEHRACIDRAVVMIQREVRDRLLARPGTKAYGALTVFVTAAFEVTSLFRVPAGAFYPAPKVDSAVVRLTPLTSPRAEETGAFRDVVRAGFEARRKTLRNALEKVTGGKSSEVLAAAGIDPRRRAETLSVEEFAALARAREDVRSLG